MVVKGLLSEAVAQSPNYCCTSSGAFPPGPSWVDDLGFDFSDIPRVLLGPLASATQATLLCGPELPAPTHLGRGSKGSQTQCSNPPESYLDSLSFEDNYFAINLDLLITKPLCPPSGNQEQAAEDAPSLHGGSIIQNLHPPSPRRACSLTS